MPTAEYLEAERKMNAALNTRHTIGIGISLTILGLLMWACGGAAALI